MPETVSGTRRLTIGEALREAIAEEMDATRRCS